MSYGDYGIKNRECTLNRNGEIKMNLADNFITYEKNENGEWVRVTPERIEEKKTGDNCCNRMNWTFHDDEWCEKTGERISKHHYTCNYCGDVTQVG